MFTVALELLLVAVASLAIFGLFKKWKINSRLPPTPPGHWFWGHQVDMKNAPEQFRQWQKEYGDIYRVNMGGLKAVVLSGEEGIYEALVKNADSFSGRPKGFRINAINSFHGTVSFQNSTPHQRDMKKALMTCLKMYGERLLHLEAIALESIQEFMERLETYKDQPFDPQKHVFTLTLQIMYELVCGERISTERINKIQYWLKETDLIFAPYGPGKELEVFPFLRHFGNSSWKFIQRIAKFQWQMFDEILQERKVTCNIQNPRCLLDALFRHQIREKLPDGNPKIDETDIHMIIQEAIGAGTLTTVGATYAFIALMANYPDIQHKLKSKVDNVVGSRKPRLTDRPEMPYTEATILEILRYVSHVPTLLPHMTIKDATIQGYFIPKGTQVWINVYNMHHDERYWEKPWTFMPERFLDENGHLVTADHPNRKRLLPFGAGKRVCPGEVLARNRLFLFFSSMMQNFTFIAAEGKDKPITDPKRRLPGLVTQTPPYKVFAKSRRD